MKGIKDAQINDSTNWRETMKTASIYTMTANHRDGSRKSKVHATFAKLGPDAALTQGRRLKLKEETLKSWFRTWSTAKYLKADAKATAKAKATKSKKAA